MRDAISRLRANVDRGTLLFVSKINIYGLGLLAFWTVVNTTLLPDRVADTARDAFAGSAVGLISFVGVGLAVIIQPLAGRLSDAWPFSDPRRPFIITGTLLVIPGIVLFATATSFVVLLVGFVLMQLATNISQAAFQALIPDLVAEDQRGIASGVKNVLSVLGAALGLLGAQALLEMGASTGWAIAYVGGLVVLTGILSLVWVPRIEPKVADADDRTRRLRTAVSPRKVWNEFSEALRVHATFRWAVIAQFLFLLGTYAAQRYLLLFLRDRFGEGAEARASVGVGVAIVLAIVAAGAAGALSDVAGRRPVLIGSVIIGSGGLALIGFSFTIAIAGLAGGLIAVGLGAFQAVNWALLNDDLPAGQAATALGIANVATAGAGAVAGLFGPIVDAMNAVLPQGTYQVLFGLAALVALLSVVPLGRVDAGATSGRAAT